MTPDTIFRIASQTKAMTSVAILSLLEEGKIGLNEPASRFIPSFAKTTVSVREERRGRQSCRRSGPITIRDLLTHTAGISYGTEPTSPRCPSEGPGTGGRSGLVHSPTRASRSATTMERLGTLPFVAQPGERWVYGYNTDILGCVVERASGMPLDQVVRTRITGPLGMKDTQFFLPPAERERLAAVYSSGPDGTYRACAGGSRKDRATTSMARASSWPAGRGCCRPRVTTAGSSR